MTAAPLAAQSRATGRVIRITSGDTVPVVQVPVVLHRVGRAAQGPLDTTDTDREGRFGFRFRADSGAAYLLSVRYAGIQYFSSAIGTDSEHPDTTITILVADTSSSAPVTAKERTLLVSRSDETGTRTVVDWLVLQNAGERTRVSPDSVRPSWGGPLPPDAQNVELADATISQFSAQALEFRRDSVLLFAPLSPGRKELVLQYRIPGTLRRFSVPLPAGLDSAFVLLEDPRARMMVPPWTVSDSQRIEGRVFRRWTGSTADVASLEIEFPAPPVSTRLMLPLLVGATACGFALLALFTLRRRRAPSTPNPLYLADAIARLDAAQLERGAAGSPEETARYLAERARLKAELSKALAGAPERS